MADDKQERIETLQDRVDELEATVSKMLPSRRDALKLGAAGAVGAVGMAGSASAQNSNQVGTIGTDSDRVDVNAEDIDAVSVNTSHISVVERLTLTEGNGLSVGSDNSINPSNIYHAVEEGDSTTLSTIEPRDEGDLLFLRGTSSGSPVTVSHGTGNILLNDQSDAILDFGGDILALLWLGGDWAEWGYSDTG